MVSSREHSQSRATRAKMEFYVISNKIWSIMTALEKWVKFWVYGKWIMGARPSGNTSWSDPACRSLRRQPWLVQNICYECIMTVILSGNAWMNVAFSRMSVMFLISVIRVVYHSGPDYAQYYFLFIFDLPNHSQILFNYEWSSGSSACFWQTPTLESPWVFFRPPFCV